MTSLKRGFSLAEVLISISVIAIGLLGTLAALSYGVRGQKVSGDYTLATNYARQLIELVRVRNLDWQDPLPAGLVDTVGGGGLDDPTTQTRPLGSAPFQADFVGLNTVDQNFRRSIQIARVSNVPTDYRYRIKQITVSVYWWDKRKLKRLTMLGYHAQP